MDTCPSKMTVSPHLAVYVIIIAQIMLSQCAAVPPQTPTMVPQFSVPDNNKLEHIVVHQDTGDVYLGAHNMIYKLDDGLTMQSQQNWLTAGIDGATTPCPGNINCEAETNENKILLIDYENDFLFSCGSAHSGTCVLHGLDSVANIESRVNSNLANDSIAVGESVVAYFGQFQDLDRTYNALYVGSTYENNPPSSSIIQHAVATHRLTKNTNDQWQIKLAYEEALYGRFTYIDLRNDDVKKDFKIKYVYGFSIPGNDDASLTDTGFSYFLTVQKEDIDRNNYVTKITRVCQEDKGYFSYTELTLRCRSKSGDNLRLLQAAYLGKAGDHLIDSLSNVPSDAYILYAVFSRGTSASSNEPTTGSALCVYPITKIDEKILTGVQKCFNAERSDRGLRHIERAEDVQTCQDIDYRTLRHNFCGTALFHPIDTGMMFTEVDILRGGGNGEIFTSVIAKPDGDATIAVIGTQSGHLLKYLLEPEDEDSDTAGTPFKNLLLDGPVLQDMTFDPTEEHVYAMTPDTVYKFALSTCDHYTECSACILTHDPNECGWCGSGCAMRDECEEEGGTWMKDVCPPVIYEVSPLSAPLNSKVTLTLLGDNLGTGLFERPGEHVHEFTVAGKPCVIQQDSDDKRIECTVEAVTEQLYGPVVAHVVSSSVDPIYKVNGTFSFPSRFFFSDSSIESFKPAYGRVDGGTILTIFGTGLNSGNTQIVTVAGIPCHIISSNNTAIMCTTEEAADLKSGTVELSVDGKHYASRQAFSYSTKPTITTYGPTKSHLSGGRLLVVNGEGLHVVEDPKIAVTIDNGQQVTIEQACQKADSPGDVMVCPSPNITSQGLSTSNEEPIKALVSLIFDGWYSSPLPIGPVLMYYADPVVNVLPDGIDVSNGGSLTIEGRNLNTASNKSEVVVMIGEDECKLTKLSAAMLQCRVPSIEGVINEADLPVKITFGNFMAEIGTVNYIRTSNTLNVTAIIIAIVFLAITIFVVIIIYFVMKAMRQKRKRVADEAIALDQAIGLARSLSQNGSQYSGSQFSGESRVVPPTAPHGLRNTYARNPSAESHIAESRPLLQQIGNELAAQVGEVLINESNLQLGQTLGQGHFGCVYEGIFLQDGEELHVAVKSLLRGSSSEITSFLKEGIMMKDFKHPHVLRLIGVCIKDAMIPLVVLPYMKHGDILTYIRNPQNDLTARQLLEFCRGIADGMAYLASLKFVHRDLAARNCMLNEEFVVKVADFGLSRDIYERDYYSAKDKTAKLPVRWMALECLERNIYNAKTDVWSYGIVMWELMTRGITPYPSVDNYDLSQYLQCGRRLPQPDHCPDSVYDVMYSCWMVVPVDRPNFSQLVATLDEILNTENDEQVFDREDDLYINVPHL